MGVELLADGVCGAEWTAIDEGMLSIAGAVAAGWDGDSEVDLQRRSQDSDLEHGVSCLPKCGRQRPRWLVLMACTALSGRCHQAAEPLD